MGDENRRTLGECIDSGQVTGISFKSPVPVNSKSDDTYVVNPDKIPRRDDTYLSLIPRSSEDRIPVEVPLWQHLGDEVIG